MFNIFCLHVIVLLKSVELMKARFKIFNKTKWRSRLQYKLLLWVHIFRHQCLNQSCSHEPRRHWRQTLHYSAKNKLTNKENSVCSGAATCLPHPQPAQWLLDSAAPAPPWPGRCAPPGEGACGWRNRGEVFRCFEDWMQSKVEGRQDKQKEN